MEHKSKYIIFLTLYILGGCLSIFSINLFSIIGGGLLGCVAIHFIRQSEHKGIKAVMWLLAIVAWCSVLYLIAGYLKEIYLGGIFLF